MHVGISSAADECRIGTTYKQIEWLSFFYSSTLANQSLLLRLTRTEGSNSSDRGLVEVFDGVSKWGSICSFQWGFKEAYVACRHLGYKSAFAALTVQESSHIEAVLPRVSCDLYRYEDYTSLDQCRFYPWLSRPRRCTPHNVAGVICSGKRQK